MNDTSHELVCAVKELAIELGRTPTRVELENRVINLNGKLGRMGGFSVLLQMAGLETYNERRSGKKLKITKESLFGRSIEEVVEQHVPRVVESNFPDFRPILAIGDTHFPFAHQPTLEKIYRFAEKEQPEFIIQMGDLMDQFSHSRFPTSRNVYRPDEEMELGKKQAQEFWDALRKACPKAKIYGLMGNHDIRPLRAVLAAAPSLESLVRDSVKRLYHFEGVEMIEDYREELQIQGVMFHHGYMSKNGQQRDFVLQNLCSAHTHRGEVSFRPLKDKIIWHLNPGFTGDDQSKASSYTPQKTTGWTLGWGWMDEYGPRFIPA